MSSAVTDTPKVELPRGRPSRSPFEKSILPDFAKWLLREVKRRQPDIFVPVETKGALLLAAADKYTTNELGQPLGIPVLYRPALAYLDADELADQRTVMLDDAIGSGNTTKWHRYRVEKHGVRHIDMLACVGLDTGDTHDRFQGDDDVDDHTRDLVKCFRLVDETRYREMLWQVSEFVVARGLPPEVDHHVFDLRLGIQVADAWPVLVQRLRTLGNLSVDGPTTTNGDVISMTLHFPTLPNARRHPLRGPVRDEGVKKLRLFADLANDTIHVVPMAFPALDLDSGNREGIPEDVARNIAGDWTEQEDDVARLLLDRARSFSPEMLFRIISAATETDMVFAFATELAAGLPDQILSLTADRKLFGCLYGQAVGTELADRVDAGIARAIEAGRHATPASPRPDSLPLLRVDDRVRWATAEIAEHLTWLYRARACEEGFDPTTRVGLSLTELERDAAFGKLDLLTLSRCIDFGLAMTTLVPYTDVTEREDGSVEVRRRYRVSETRRARSAHRKYEDVETNRQLLDEETLALIARTLGAKIEQWKDGVPLAVLERVAALLTTVVVEEGGVGLRVEATRDGMQVRLGEHQPKTVRTVVSEMFEVIGETVRPSPAFEASYAAQDLGIDGVRATKAIESHIGAIAAQLSGAPDAEALLHGWSLRAQPHFGLEIIDQHLRDAIDALQPPLKRLASATVPDPKLVVDSVTRGRDFAGAALDVVEALASGPAQDLHTEWQATDRLETDLRDALVAPGDPDTLLLVARQTVEAVSVLAGLVGSLEHWPADDQSGGEDTAALAAEVVDACDDLMLGLVSLAEPGAHPATPDDPAELSMFVARALKTAGAMLRSRAGAIAWSYRGRRNPALEPGEPRRVTVLIADMKGSTRRGVRDTHESATGWARDCLNLCVQWGTAFGGVEITRKEGDAVFIEFDDVDHAVACGATIQQHTKALRNAGRRAPDWRLRLAVDQAEMTVEGNNVYSSALNVGSKLCDWQKDDDECIERVMVTPEAREASSPTLREKLLLEHPKEIVIDAEPGPRGLDAGVRFRPFVADAESVLRALLEEGAAANAEEAAA